MLPSEETGIISSVTRKTWSPAVDISEDDQCYHIRMDLAGLRPGDAAVQVVGNTITIRGQRHLPTPILKEKLHRGERHFGAFVRSFLVPNDANIRKLSLDYQAGVMSVVIAKIKVNRVDHGTGKAIGGPPRP
jgi:HSP20 family protein